MAVSDEEIAARLSKWQAPKLKVNRGTLAKYAHLVGDASHGVRSCSLPRFTIVRGVEVIILCFLAPVFLILIFAVGALLHNDDCLRRGEQIIILNCHFGQFRSWILGPSQTIICVLVVHITRKPG